MTSAKGDSSELWDSPATPEPGVARVGDAGTAVGGPASGAADPATGFAPEGASGGPAGGPVGREPPSILVLTKNEEINIAACLETLSFSDDIVVLDSYSTDRTVEIAKSFPNVRVIQRKFDTWSKHSNWALDHIEWKHPWVYYSDADERVPVELREEIVRAVNDAAAGHAAYRLRYKNMFMGQWIRRGGLYPVWIIRLFRPAQIRYEEREVNAHPVVNGTLGDLQEHFIHYSFNKGLKPWFIKHNSYSDMEAKEAVRVLGGSFARNVKLALSGPTPAVKRRALKDLSFFIPLRATARFAYMYIARLGILDGPAGFHYAAMISMYEYWIEIKIREQQQAWKPRTERTVTRMLADDRRGA